MVNRCAGITTAGIDKIFNYGVNMNAYSAAQCILFCDIKAGQISVNILWTLHKAIKTKYSESYNTLNFFFFLPKWKWFENSF